MDLEQVYDEQLAALMDQVIAVAKENNMPFVFSFQLSSYKDGPLLCTSCLLPEGCDAKLVQAKEILYRRAPTSSLMITTRSAEGTITTLEHILFKE